jgi:hypothetical protein
MRVNASKYASVYFSESGLFNGLQPIQIRKFSDLKLSIACVLSGNSRTPRRRPSRSDAKHRVSKAGPARKLVGASWSALRGRRAVPLRTRWFGAAAKKVLHLKADLIYPRWQLVSHCPVSPCPSGDLQFIAQISVLANMGVLIFDSRPAYCKSDDRSSLR